MEQVEQTKGFNSNVLKLIAIVAMTIDHLTWVFFPGCQYIWYVILFHIIGRLTAPIMWFFIAEGYFYTKNVKKYIIRLFIFAIISHFAYCFAFGLSFLPSGFLNQTSIMWSLAWAVVELKISDSKKIPEWLKYITLFLILFITFPSDWSCISIMAILFIKMNRGNFKKQMIAIVFWSLIYSIVYFIFIDKMYGLLQLFTFLSIPFLKLYNGKRGNWKSMKWLFYFYYPIHLILVGVIRILLWGNISMLF